LILIEFNN